MSFKTKLMQFYFATKLDYFFKKTKFYINYFQKIFLCFLVLIKFVHFSHKFIHIVGLFTNKLLFLLVKF